MRRSARGGGGGGARRRGSRSSGGFSMCGIVGYVGQRPVQDLLLAGLEKLEYRGYDSAGISMLVEGHVESVRAVGNLSALRDAVAVAGGGGGVAVAPKPATTGIGHTRGATHGRAASESGHT